MAKEDEVREAAYFVWLNNGCPEGVEIDCWLEAEAQESGKGECQGEECCCCCCEEVPAEEVKAEEKPAAKKAPAKKAAAKK